MRSSALSYTQYTTVNDTYVRILENYRGLDKVRMHSFGLQLLDAAICIGVRLTIDVSQQRSCKYKVLGILRHHFFHCDGTNEGLLAFGAD